MVLNGFGLAPTIKTGKLDCEGPAISDLPSELSKISIGAI